MKFSYNRSNILRSAWLSARSAAARDGRHVLSHIGATMRTAWSDAKLDLLLDRYDEMQPFWHAEGLSMEAFRAQKLAALVEAASAAVPPVTQLQQAVVQQFADFDPADFDPEGARPDLVCAFANEARIILAGMDAAAAGQDPRAAEIASAAATVHPLGVPNNGWLYEEVSVFIDSVMLEVGDVADSEPVLPRLSDRYIAEWGAYHATKAWTDLIEQDRDAPLSVSFGDLFDARQAMQAAHAHLDAITAQGAV